jgi:hypothetical protein
VVTKESFISICWRLVPYWLNNWEHQWGAECSSMMFELPHFAMELLVVLPCVQVSAEAGVSGVCQVIRACMCGQSKHCCMLMVPCKGENGSTGNAWMVGCCCGVDLLCMTVCVHLQQNPSMHCHPAGR